MRLDSFLATELRISRSQAQNWLAEGFVTVNGKSAVKKHLVDEQDMITVAVPEARPYELEPQNIPLDIYYTDEGYCLLTSDALRFFNNNDEIVSELKFGEKKLLSGNIYGNRALMTYGLKGLSGGTNAVVYDKNGKEEFSVSFDYSLSDTLINGDILYALAPGKLSICNISTGETEHYDIPTSYSSLIAYDDRLIIFSENQAEYFDASKHDKTEASE